MKVDTIYAIAFPERPHPSNDYHPEATRKADPGNVFSIRRRKPVKQEVDSRGRETVKWPFRQMREGEALLLCTESQDRETIRRLYKSAWQCADNMGVVLECVQSYEASTGVPYMVLIVRHESTSKAKYAE